MSKFATWLETFSKRAVFIILIVSLIDLQLSYILAFLGKEQIAESLSTTIAEMIIGVMLGYFLKALFETFFEKREERLNKQIDQEMEENAHDQFADLSPGADDYFDPDESCDRSYEEGADGE